MIAERFGVRNLTRGRAILSVALTAWLGWGMDVQAQGYTRLNISGTDGAFGAALNPAGQLVVVGNGGDDFAVARYVPGGTLDTAFNGSGFNRFNISGTDAATALAFQADGKVVVAGDAGDDYGVARLTTAGVLDSTFGVGGMVRHNISGSEGAAGVAVQSNGKFVVVGNGGEDMTAIRLTTTGQLDTTFGLGGICRVNISGTDGANAVVIQSDGRILMAGSGGADFCVVRLTAAGAVDTTFGSAGQARINISGTDAAYALALQPDGKILLAGNGGADFCVVRLTAAGALDATFGSAGIKRVNISGSDAAFAVRVLPDGKILVAGGDGGGDYGVVRLTSSGVVDTTFGSYGIQRINISGTEAAYALALPTDGKILLAGNGGADFCVVRLMATGALDTSFPTAPPTRPGVPANLSASDGAFTTKVLVQWSGVASATRYKVFRATSATGTRTEVGATANTSWDDTTATVGQHYYYSVKASNSAGDSDYSAVNSGYRVSVLPLPMPPATVTASDGAYTTKVLVQWDAASGASSYKVHRASSATGTRTLLATPSGTLFEDTTGTVGQTYYYWIKASNGAGDSAYSASDSGFRVNVLPLPKPPATVTASDGAYTTKVLVQWAGVSGAASYKVYRASSTTGTRTLLAAPSETLFEDTTATLGRTYYYWVKASNSTGDSIYSAVETGFRQSLPAAPLGIAASDGTFTTKVLLQWNAVSSATRYTVYRATSASGTRASLGATVATNFDDTSALAGQAYYYWVRTSNAAGDGPYSAYNIGFRNPGGVATIPTAPTNVFASTGTYRDNVHLGWNPVSRASQYKVFRATHASGARTLLVTTDNDYFYDMTAQIGQVYTYWIKAGNAAGDGPDSAPTSGYVDSRTPVLMTPTDGAVNVSRMPSFSWSKVLPAVTQYEIEIQVDTYANPARTAMVTGQTYVLPEATSLAANKRFLWRVRSRSAQGAGPWSAYSSFTTANVTVLAAPAQLNPLNGKTNVRLRPTFKWTAVTGATSYCIEICRGEPGLADRAYPNANFPAPLAGTAFTVPASAEALRASTTYHWRVRALTGSGAGRWSPYARFVTQAP